MKPTEKESLLNRQEVVFSLIGRCLLNLQNYEHAMKALLSDHRFSGFVQGIESSLARRNAKFSKQTLGQLVAELTGSFLANEARGNDAGKENSSSVPVEVAHVSFHCSIQMSDEVLDQTKEGLSQLVALRNELVHHFSEQFDLHTLAGCQAAEAYLVKAREQIILRNRELATWAKALVDLRQLTADTLLNMPI